jgi:formylglycine-generating enzyme required for sulfatase activity
VSDPKTDTLPRVLRGGSWNDNDAVEVRVEIRSWGVPAIRRNILGFRCARGGSERKVKP